MIKQFSKVQKISILTLGQGVNIIVSFLFMPYMARALSYFDYGTYGQTILIITLVISLLSFGLSKIIFVYLNKDLFDSREVFTNNVLSGISLGLLGFTLVYISSNWIAYWFNNISLVQYLKIYALSIVFSIPNLSINSFLIFRGQVKESVLILISTNIVKVLLVVISIQFYQSLSLAFWGIVFSGLLQFFIGVLLLSKQMKFQLNWKLIKLQLENGLPLALTGILGITILYTDGLMISKLMGVKEYAIYRNGALEVPFIATVYGSIATIIMPEISKLWSKNKILEIKELKFKVISYTAVLIYPVMIYFMFNSQELITLYLGVKYEESALIFMVFNLTLFIRINDYSDALIASGNTKYIFYCYLSTMLLNFLLNYFFIQWLGGVGAAISTVLSIFILAFLQFKKTLNLIDARIENLLNLKFIFIVLIISIAFAYVFKYFSHLLITRVSIQLLISSLLYFSTIYFILIKMKMLPMSIINQILPFRTKTK